MSKVDELIGQLEATVAFDRAQLRKLCKRAAALTDLQAQVAAGENALRNMADTVAVYAQQPIEFTRRRSQIQQDQWDQIATICGNLLKDALAQYAGKDRDDGTA